MNNQRQLQPVLQPQSEFWKGVENKPRPEKHPEPPSGTQLQQRLEREAKEARRDARIGLELLRSGIVKEQTALGKTGAGVAPKTVQTYLNSKRKKRAEQRAIELANELQSFVNLIEAGCPTSELKARLAHARELTTYVNTETFEEVRQNGKAHRS